MIGGLQKSSWKNEFMEFSPATVSKGNGKAMCKQRLIQMLFFFGIHECESVFMCDHVLIGPSNQQTNGRRKKRPSVLMNCICL